MKDHNKWQIKLLGFAMYAASAIAVAQDTKPLSQSPACERDPLGVCMLPPLPPPTEAQLQKGRELLDKIIYVIENVPLSDEVVVMKTFGFTELFTYESKGSDRYSPYRDTRPKGKRGGFSLPEEIMTTGFSSLLIRSVFVDNNINLRPTLDGSFVDSEACLSIDDVTREFQKRARSNQVSPIVDVHPIRRPKWKNQIGHLNFSYISAANRKIAGITFTFEYQDCAARFATSYNLN